MRDNDFHIFVPRDLKFAASFAGTLEQCYVSTKLKVSTEFPISHKSEA